MPIGRIQNASLATSMTRETAMKRLTLLLILLLAGCTHTPAATSAPAIEYQGAHVTEGAGIKLSIPRVVGAREWIKPIMRWFDPGEGHSPYIADLFPCESWSCRGKYALTLNLYIKRANSPDLTEPSEPEDRLRHRVLRILKPIDTKSARHPKPLDPRDPKTIVETLQIRKLGDGVWARLEHRYKDGSPAGLVYWRVIDRELTASASYWFESAPLPKGVTIDALDRAFESFVSGIRMEAEVTPPLPK
jgi:hypothetical protein